jgi:hypothetical protein
MKIRIEFKPQDAFIGAFWKTGSSKEDFWRTTDLWICIVPMLPIHLTWRWMNKKGWRIA